MEEKRSLIVRTFVISFACLLLLFAGAAAQEECSDSGGLIQCNDNCKCPDNMVCTLNWNRGILYQLEALGISDGFGHCIDPRQSAHIDGPAIQADLDVLQQLHDTSDTDWTAPRLAIPYNFPDRSEIRVDQAISISFKTFINGNGATIRTNNNTAGGLIFSASSQGSKLQDISIHAFSVSQTNSGIGIDVQASNIHIDNVNVAGMGYGVRAWDTDGGGPMNVSLQRWRDMRITGSDEYGIYIDGNDANASLFTGLSLSGNDVGIMESGFLGSTYVGNHLEQNTVGLRTDSTGASRSTFVGTYIENSDEIDMSTGSAWMTTVGGQLSARPEVVGDRIGAQRSHLIFEGRASDLTDAEDLHLVKVEIPSVFQGTQGNRMAAMQFFYKFEDCNTQGCTTITYPRWKIDRRLDIGPEIDAWEIRPTNATTSINRTVFSWTSDVKGNVVTPEIKRYPVCDYVNLMCGP